MDPASRRRPRPPLAAHGDAPPPEAPGSGGAPPGGNQPGGHRVGFQAGPDGPFPTQLQQVTLQATTDAGCSRIYRSAFIASAHQRRAGRMVGAVQRGARPPAAGIAHLPSPRLLTGWQSSSPSVLPVTSGACPSCSCARTATHAGRSRDPSRPPPRSLGDRPPRPLSRPALVLTSYRRVITGTRWCRRICQGLGPQGRNARRRVGCRRCR